MSNVILKYGRDLSFSRQKLLLDDLEMSTVKSRKLKSKPLRGNKEKVEDDVVAIASRSESGIT